MSLRPTFNPLNKGSLRRRSSRRSSNAVDYSKVAVIKATLSEPPSPVIEKRSNGASYESVLKEIQVLRELIFNQDARINHLEMKLKSKDQEPNIVKSVSSVQKEKSSRWFKIFQR